MGRRAGLLLAVMTAALVMVACPTWAGTGDTTPDGTWDSDPTAAVVCTLREAIQEAMANNNDPTVDVINFAIPGAGPHTISPGSDFRTEITR
jgi:CSLREA domain-containing protein